MADYFDDNPDAFSFKEGSVGDKAQVFRINSKVDLISSNIWYIPASY